MAVLAVSTALSPQAGAQDHAATLTVNTRPDPATPQTQSPAIAPCAGIRTSASSAAPTYIDEPIQELRRQVSALNGIRFESAQEQTASILDQTGVVITDLLHRMPNLLAREEVRWPTTAAPSSIEVARRGSGLEEGTLDSPGAGQYRSQMYVYRIVLVPDPAGAEILNEFRTDGNDHPINDSSRDHNIPHNVGFVMSWLFFLPGNRQDSHFRYLGQQKIGKRETFVLAFAQIPEHDRHYTVVASGSDHKCSTPSQGIAWIDKSTYSILQMQTDLLYPLPVIKLNQLRTILNYSEVRIPERDLVLWLPVNVRISWETANASGDELHFYSHYRLFGSTVRILPDAESSPQ
jgi:hypothetical protein